ncbi:MAG TPA: hypothetical protein VK796_04105 [Cytophaga sp.]|jgi:hypothetical protein|nr:hypothetical protein [Cytophaga sp.]
MKRICVILFAAGLSAATLSCKENTSSENAKDHLHEAGDNIKNAVDSTSEAIKEETKKTTKNDGDAH